MMLVVYLGHGTFYPVAGFFFLPKSIFWGGKSYIAPKIDGTSEKKGSTSIEVRVTIQYSVHCTAQKSWVNFRSLLIVAS